MACPCLGVDYAVTVTVFGAQEQQVLEIPNIVQLQCTISPTPPFPVVYIWSSSTQNHYLETSLFDAESRAIILIYERQPSIGRYFCHVLLASNHTTLAVGHITIFLSGELYLIHDNAHANCELEFHSFFCYRYTQAY